MGSSAWKHYLGCDIKDVKDDMFRGDKHCHS